MTTGEEFAKAVAAIGEGVERVSEPFQFVLDQLDLPAEVAEAGPRHCLAEEAISGNQVATEGYVYQGNVHVYRVLDSVTYPDSSVFLRHQFPSQIAKPVCHRLCETTKTIIKQIGLDNATFSIEFFHNPDTDAITVLEVNPRHSQSHAPLFGLVDGVPNHHVMLRLATGRDSVFDSGPGKGDYEIAGMYNYRRFRDGVVRRVPTGEELDRLCDELPSVTVRPIPEQGQRLSELAAQDSYSYELADVVVGANSVEELEQTYERAIERLRFAIDDVDDIETEPASHDQRPEQRQVADAADTEAIARTH